MGFPVGYPELLVPKLLVNIACVLGFMGTTLSRILRCVGLGGFLEPETSWREHQPDHFEVFSPVSVSARMIRECLPVVTFGSSAEGFERAGEVVCAVCLNQLESHHHVRPLANCCHIFHKGCLDKWLDHGHATCPLCRAIFLPEGAEMETPEDLWTVERISHLFGDVSSSEPSYEIQNQFE